MVLPVGFTAGRVLLDRVTGFDFSNAYYGGVSYSVASQDIQPSEVVFNDVGTKMYVLGDATDSVYQYSLSTAYDLSTASYDSVSFDVSSEETGPDGISFNNDGTKMYIIGSVSDAIHQYTLSTAYDISTASYDSVTLSTPDQPAQLAFNDNGTKLFAVTNFSLCLLREYELSTAYDLSTASLSSFFSLENEVGNAQSLAFDNNGKTVYILDAINGVVHRYTLSTAFDISTISYDSSVLTLSDVGFSDNIPSGMVFNDDYTKMYVVGLNSSSIYEYPIAIPLKIDESTDTLVTLDTEASSTSGIHTSSALINNGRYLYIAGRSDSTGGGQVDRYYLSTPYDLSTASYREKYEFDGIFGIQAIRFDSSGQKMYVLSSVDDKIYRYSGFFFSGLGSVTQDNYSISVGDQPSDFVVSDDGSRFFVVYPFADRIGSKTLDPPDDTRMRAIAFSSDGAKLLVLASNPSTSVYRVYQYHLRVAYDVSTAVYENRFFDAPRFANDSIELVDGDSVMYILDSGGTLYQISTGLTP